MSELTPEKLNQILTDLDRLCREAQELQRRLKSTMAEQARRDYPSSERPTRRRRDT